MEQLTDDVFSGLGIMVLIICLVVLVFYVWSVVWAYMDARRRGKPGWLVALVVLLMVWPVGLLLWLLLRPQSQRHQV
ncbi:hypothetical protein [Pontibacter roseus]|uniref:hypothetical protein n=1 Tax=Pontibacter roseus TaxID=336989 RepID=UPI00036AA4AC|nr:hypothetical protein [Pontibacter roseus]